MKIKLIANNILKVSIYTKGLFFFGFFTFMVGSIFTRGVHGFKDWVFLIPSLLGLIMMVSSSKVEIIFDKSRGIFIHRVKRIFNIKEKQYKLSDIDKIIIEGISQNGPNYRLVILMKEGWSVPATSYLTSESNYYSAKLAANKINAFLFSKD